MKAVIFFILVLLVTGCDSFTKINSEIDAWLEESRKQRELIATEREKKEKDDDDDDDDDNDDNGVYFVGSFDDDDDEDCVTNNDKEKLRGVLADLRKVCEKKDTLQIIGEGMEDEIEKRHMVTCSDIKEFITKTWEYLDEEDCISDDDFEDEWENTEEYHIKICGYLERERLMTRVGRIEDIRALKNYCGVWDEDDDDDDD